jgi:hypothetical protein
MSPKLTINISVYLRSSAASWFGFPMTAMSRDDGGVGDYGSPDTSVFPASYCLLRQSPLT